MSDGADLLNLRTEALNRTATELKRLRDGIRETTHGISSNTGLTCHEARTLRANLRALLNEEGRP